MPLLLTVPPAFAAPLLHARLRPSVARTEWDGRFACRAFVRFGVCGFVPRRGRWTVFPAASLPLQDVLAGYFAATAYQLLPPNIALRNIACHCHRYRHIRSGRLFSVVVNSICVTADGCGCAGFLGCSCGCRRLPAQCECLRVYRREETWATMCVKFYRTLCAQVHADLLSTILRSPWFAALLRTFAAAFWVMRCHSTTYHCLVLVYARHRLPCAFTTSSWFAHTRLFCGGLTMPAFTASFSRTYYRHHLPG